MWPHPQAEKKQQNKTPTNQVYISIKLNIIMFRLCNYKYPKIDGKLGRHEATSIQKKNKDK